MNRQSERLRKKTLKEREKKLKEYKKAWYRANREKMAIYAKEYYKENKDKWSARTDARRSYEAQYREKNREKINSYHTEYALTRRKTDPSFRAIQNARVRARDFIRGNQKYSKRLRCSFKVFKIHIESQFVEGMTWENYGEWHIDHVFPLSVAFEQGPEIFSNACKYTNLQPLWASDNISKGNKTILNQ